MMHFASNREGLRLPIFIYKQSALLYNESMRFHIVTIFPKMFDSYFAESILARAIATKKIQVSIYDLRTFSKDKHKKVDDKPYGGGPGMVITVDPIVRAVESVQKKISSRAIRSAAQGKETNTKVLLFTPEQTPFTTALAKSYATHLTDIIMVCGRYEGIDARVKDILCATELSIGDYVLTGGEIPAMVLVDCVSRQIEGVLGDFESLEESRASSHLVYTRPAEYSYKGKSYVVPEVLQNGNHKEIDRWRNKKN
jgi:tRNA (guanine37-N1)-methyltransferase